MPLEAEGAAGKGDVVIRRESSDQAEDQAAAGLDRTEVIQARGAVVLASLAVLRASRCPRARQGHLEWQGAQRAEGNRVLEASPDSSTQCRFVMHPGEHRQAEALSARQFVEQHSQDLPLGRPHNHPGNVNDNVGFRVVCLPSSLRRRNRLKGFQRAHRNSPDPLQ